MAASASASAPEAGIAALEVIQYLFGVLSAIVDDNTDVSVHHCVLVSACVCNNPYADEPATHTFTLQRCVA